tara:strand:- start:188 stop:820 length:633 start_codon:yes stop_codon:yes gene_type:complete
MIREFEKRLLTSLILIPISIFFIVKGSIFLIFFLSILFLVASYEWVLMNKKNNIFRFLGIIFLFFSFYSAFFLRDALGPDFFLFIICVCIFTDIGGYVFGKFLKGPKLTKISPNKTYAGVGGGFILSLTAGLIFLKISEDELFNSYTIDFLIFIFIISLISQIGDLIISYFKRKAKIKDTGKFLPGHGGFLDRIDGLIFVIPIIYFYTII